MNKKVCVLPCLMLFLGWVHCFSWDMIVGGATQLVYFYNGTLTHSEDIPSANYIHSITYDPVHYRVLLADLYSPTFSLHSFDLLTRKIQLIVRRNYTGHIARAAYDPVTQLLFWKEISGIYSFSLNPASPSVDANVLITLNHNCWDIAVDSSEGYIYWITDYEIERARIEGSERAILINTADRGFSLAIDQQTQRMYWTERIVKNNTRKFHVSIESADLNGKNRRTFYVVKNETNIDSLTVSKDNIYWRGLKQNVIGQLPKNKRQHEEAKLFPISWRSTWAYHVIAADYRITEQTEGNQNCGEIPNAPDANPTDAVCLHCIHGTKVIGESRCDCTQGYTGERCEVSACQNYCFQGDCSVSAEGQPKCRCHVGYSGERCEINACHKHCLNNGVCALNEEDEPVCECSSDYDGERCEVATTRTGQSCCCQDSKQDVLRDLRREARQVIKEELQHTLRYVSNKIDEYKVNV